MQPVMTKLLNTLMERPIRLLSNKRIVSFAWICHSSRLSRDRIERLPCLALIFGLQTNSHLPIVAEAL